MTAKSSSIESIHTRKIHKRILLVQGFKVILDYDLARLYGVSTKRLNEQVKRNRTRFPADFMFQLTLKEKKEVVANCDHLQKLKYSPVRPYAFTEHGTIMAASILNTKRAVEVSVFVVRAFVILREMLIRDKALACKIMDLERKIEKHDNEIQSILEAIRQFMAPAEKPKRKIGFHPD